ncbi:hypothetical protein [Photobacterium profundum]|uniref:hypothetical protein n=1 Tax=Photobacterium profundum TaxID=74109 RepID=UPI0002FF682A|nr:hypothetical protein [Photobacterium profundum]
MNSNGETEISREEFNEFFIENYSEVQVWEKRDENGELEYVEFSGEYYFCPRVTVTFKSVKPRFTYKQIKKAVKVLKYISPLNHNKKIVPSVMKLEIVKSYNVVNLPKKEEDEDKSIKSVFVEWSECGVFNKALRTDSDYGIKKTISIEKYEEMANQQAIISNEEQ